MSAQLIKVFNAYDESLNKAHSKSYRLSIQLSLDGFSFTLFNTLNSKFISLESSEFSASDQPSEFLIAFDEMVRKHAWLTEEFAEVDIIFESFGSTLIPSALYNPNDKGVLAKFNFEVSEQMEIRADKLINCDAYLLYSVPKTLVKILNKLFPSYSLHSHAAVLIEVLMILNKNQTTGKQIFVNVRNTNVDIVIVEGKQLLFYNAFPYHSKQDFIYYIIFVIEQLNLNPEDIELRFSGKIDKKSTLFDMAWKYIRNIQFQELPSAYRYSYVFNDIPPHYYFVLLNSGVCEL